MMKSFLYILSSFMIITIASSCKENDDLKKELAQNTWTFKSEYNANGITTYEAEKVTLTIQGTGQLTAVSKTRYGGGYGGTNSTVIIYFKGMPLADKDYKVTSYNRVATHDDEVAIMVNVSGDSEIPGSGGGGSVWESDGDGSQVLSYKFGDSKGSAAFSDITLYNGVHAGKKSAQVSGKISQ